MSALAAHLARTPAPDEQPRTLYALFATEAWERFSYYGMRAILVLYMMKGLGFAQAQASNLYGIYTALVYFTPLGGGYLADRVLGYQAAALLGALVMAAGQFCLSAATLTSFYVGLGLLIVGNGLFKPTVATLVGSLYGPDDPRRDRGFTIFYMGINLGALLSPLVCGQLLGENPAFGFPWGFRAAGIGMVIGLVTFATTRRWLPRGPTSERGPSPAGPSPTQATNRPLTPTERGHIAALLVMVAFVIFFWMAFEQAGNTMTVFADESTDRNMFGFHASASLFQSVNPVFILVLAPVVSLVWRALGAAGREPSTPMKMVLGLVFLGTGFVPLVVASAIAAAHGRAGWVWLVLAYFLHTVGELCLSPVGLSLVTKLAPTKYAALLMGSWFLANVAGNYLAGLTGTFYDRVSHEIFFASLLVSSLAAASVLLLVLAPIRRLMGGVR
jgi:proton-dependent oligopeptide transporter, POT family